MILEEVIGKIEDANGPTKVATAGCSFGGYHASNFAFRHPYKVSHLLCMSAAFNIRSQMDGYYDDNVYLNNPEDFVPKMDHPELYNMKIVWALPNMIYAKIRTTTCQRFCTKKALTTGWMIELVQFMIG